MVAKYLIARLRASVTAATTCVACHKVNPDLHMCVVTIPTATLFQSDTLSLELFHAAMSFVHLALATRLLPMITIVRRVMRLSARRYAWVRCASLRGD